MPELDPGYVDRRDALFEEARGLIRSNPEMFAKAGAELAKLFPAEEPIEEGHPDHAEWGGVRRWCLFSRIDQARKEACNPDGALPERGGWFNFDANAPDDERAFSARLTILAILMGGDPKANEAITREMCELAALPYDTDSDTELGRGWVDWTERDWPHGNEPSPRVLDRIERANALIIRVQASGFEWRWNQDGTLGLTVPLSGGLESLGSAIPPGAFIPEVLEQARVLSSIVASMKADGQGGRIIGDDARMLGTALHKLALLGGVARHPLYTTVQTETREGGIVLSCQEPAFTHDELARSLIPLCMTPFGPHGHDELIGAYRLTSEQIDTLERNRTRVANLAHAQSMVELEPGHVNRRNAALSRYDRLNEAFTAGLSVAINARRAGKISADSWTDEWLPLIETGDRLLDDFRAAAELVGSDVGSPAILATMEAGFGRVLDAIRTRNARDDGAGDDGEYRPASWFGKSMAPRLRKAASEERKSKRVATRTIDGVVCYSVADARRWWSQDLPEGA